MLYELNVLLLLCLEKQSEMENGSTYLLMFTIGLHVTDRADPLHWVHLPVASERIITVSEYACYVNFSRIAFFSCL